ncbi:hypothetical protein [Mariprofundus erugo]|uniref:hypothetical protein n=1 Tax=Mariprofundus erugo TaxID=2528639 RepID=UPI00159CB78D|nr:hypothetical protein [Mariprofundus erugo]
MVERLTLWRQPSDSGPHTAPCEPEYASPWSPDHLIWRLWVVLHFLPVSITRQGILRKHDLKKISALLHENRPRHIELLIAAMVQSELLKQQGDRLIPTAIHWPTWARRQRQSMIRILRSWEQWSQADEERAISLLSQLPADRWLHLDAVVDWLRSRSEGRLATAQWLPLFRNHQASALHHLNGSRDAIYLPPLFQHVLQQQPVNFTAPGWLGANTSAPVYGYISAAGEIQLPPDCNHRVLAGLASCCAPTSVEQMITLQLDLHAIRRMGTDRPRLQQTRALLESLQSPLPQALSYLFERQEQQQPIASVAATSMVVLLHDAAAIQPLRTIGIPFTQPFRDKPELVLLDASADAHAFIHRCHEEGILLDHLIAPVQWINGPASIRAWMELNEDREGQWLEVCYQKTANSTPKQLMACIKADYYDRMVIHPATQTKQRYAWSKSMVTLEPDHILRLRQLDQDEVHKLGLDRLA